MLIFLACCSPPVGSPPPAPPPPPTAYNDKVVAFIRQPNVIDLLKEKRPAMMGNKSIRDKILAVRQDGNGALERLSHDVELTILLRYDVALVNASAQPLSNYPFLACLKMRSCPMCRPPRLQPALGRTLPIRHLLDHPALRLGRRPWPRRDSPGPTQGLRRRTRGTLTQSSGVSTGNSRPRDTGRDRQS
jgi:hypothetical protein